MPNRQIEQRIYKYPDGEEAKVTYETAGRSRKSQIKSIYVRDGDWRRVFQGVMLTSDKYLSPQEFQKTTGSETYRLRQGPPIIADRFHPRELTPGITKVYGERANAPGTESFDIYLPLTDEMRRAEEEFGWDSDYGEDEYRYPTGNENHAHCSIVSIEGRTYLLYDRPFANEDQKEIVEYRPFNRQDISAEP